MRKNIDSYTTEAGTKTDLPEMKKIIGKANSFRKTVKQKEIIDLGNAISNTEADIKSIKLHLQLVPERV